MTDNEKELIDMIRHSDNPEESICVAVEIILAFLKQHESSQEQSSVVLREPA